MECFQVIGQERIVEKQGKFERVQAEKRMANHAV